MLVVTYPTIAHDIVVPAKAYSNRDPRFLKKWRCEKGRRRRKKGGRKEEERDQGGGRKKERRRK